jgi:hypothetical protein
MSQNNQQPGATSTPTPEKAVAPISVSIAELAALPYATLKDMPEETLAAALTAYFTTSSEIDAQLKAINKRKAELPHKPAGKIAAPFVAAYRALKDGKSAALTLRDYLKTKGIELPNRGYVCANVYGALVIAGVMPERTYMGGKVAWHEKASKIINLCRDQGKPVFPDTCDEILDLVNAYGDADQASDRLDAIILKLEKRDAPNQFNSSAVEASIQTGLQLDPAGTANVTITAAIKYARMGKKADRTALKAIYLGMQSLLEAFDDGEGGQLAAEFDAEVEAANASVKVIPVPTPAPTPTPEPAAAAA